MYDLCIFFPFLLNIVKIMIYDDMIMVIYQKFLQKY